MNFNESEMFKKGDIGEKIVDDKLFKKGYHLYAPTFEAAHSFDRLIFSKKTQKFYLSDIKTKPKRLYFPDTGIDIKHYKEYKKRSEQLGMEFLLIFVDESTKEIYGNLLSKLEEKIVISHNKKHIEYPLISKGIIYFPIEKMKKIDTLTEEESKKIWDKSTMNNKYKNKHKDLKNAQKNPN